MTPLTPLTKHRLAAMLALVIGLMTIIEGGLVLLGIETKPYPVLPWLLRYNVAMGFVSLIAGHGLWRQQGWSVKLSRLVLACHGAVFMTLVAIYLSGGTVAVISVMAMLFRNAIWTGINLMVREMR